MAHLIVGQKMHLVALLVFHLDMLETMYTILVLLGLANALNIGGRRKAGISYASEFASRVKVRSFNLHTMCRMSRALFHKLYNLLTIHGNLKSTHHSSVEELVGTFLHILAHNQKTIVMKRQMCRSTKTVSCNFHLVMNVVLRLHTLLFKKPEAIPKNSTDDWWKWFKNCLGALDGIYIKVHVPTDDIPRYRSRKSEISTNVLGVCTPTCSLYMSSLGGKVPL
ncbi:hypothetical protein Pint_25990 [Pistacia integerrima]|uniref:Uncharacterized protein n=1 Tax=Pistacia integerrima TaxID=434235 RepID=A0ACC0YGX8_9ROSI|nr:hypothetical protein Pint_25990 [Pistacia integerrima]